MPESVWRINLDVDETERREVTLDGGDDRWWEQTDLTKLLLPSNWLTSIPDDIAQLPALTVLDVGTPDKGLSLTKHCLLSQHKCEEHRSALHTVLQL